MSTNFTVIILLTTIQLILSTNVTTYATNSDITNETKLCQKILCAKCTVEISTFKICQQYVQWFDRENLKQWKKRRRLWCGVYDRTMVKRSTSDTKFHSYKNMALISNETKSLSIVAQFKRKWPVSVWRRYLFEDGYLVLINPHWLTFPPPPDVVNYALGGLYIVMMLVGCSGNALVLFMYIRCRSLRTPGNILVANLALSDFFMLAKTPVFIFNSFNLGPALGKTGCIIYGFIGGLTGCTSIATLAAIALDRYWAIVRPLEPLRSLTAVRAKVLATCAWLYAAIFASIPALDIGYGRYVPEGYLTSCSFDYLTEELNPRYFIFTFFCAAWVAPFCTITYCYLNILRIVVCKRNVTQKNLEHRLSSRHVKEQVKRKAEIKLAGLVIAVIALFFASWTPYAVVALLGIFGQKELITPTASMIPALFCKTAACINPFIYIITHPKFRKEFQYFLFGDKKKRNDTFRTIGYNETTSRRISKNLSETDVEVVEMKDIIPYNNPENRSPEIKMKSNIKTVSGRVMEREGSQRSASMKSLEEDMVPPPSWFAKPQFSKKKSFHRISSKSVVSMTSDPII